MQQTATMASSSGSTSFAGIIAALAAPAQQVARIDDGLADDVASLSYERALRTHSRFTAPEASNQAFTQSDQAFTQSLDPDVLRFCKAIPDEADRDTRIAFPQAEPAWKADAKIASHISTALDRNLKCASITIRLSQTECTQLRIRAAEAGLTVSAYLRSCTFEAESLRALVKDTLAQLRTDPSPACQPASVPAQRKWRHWLASLWPHARAAQSVARA